MRRAGPIAMKPGLAIAFSILAACAAHTGPVASAAKPMNESIAGTKWVMEAEGDPDQRPRLEFTSDGRVSGYSGCNTFGGTWRIEGGMIVLGPLMMTKRACAGPGDAIERRFLQAVSPKARLSIDGARLVAQGEGGARIELAPAR